MAHHRMMLLRTIAFRKPYPAPCIADFRLAKPKHYYEEDESDNPNSVSHLSRDYLNKDERVKTEELMEAQVQQYIDKYDIKNWVNVNSMVTISWDTWLTLNFLERRAIVTVVNEVVKDRESDLEKQRKDMEMKMKDLHTGSPIKDISNTSMGRMMK